MNDDAQDIQRTSRNTRTYQLTLITDILVITQPTREDHWIQCENCEVQDDAQWSSLLGFSLKGLRASRLELLDIGVGLISSL